MYHYFARQVPTNSKATTLKPGVFYVTAVRWECIFIVKDEITLADNALYTQREDKSQIFLHRVSALEFELPECFDIPSMSREQFDEQYGITRPQLIKHPNDNNKRIPAKPWAG